MQSKIKITIPSKKKEIKLKSFISFYLFINFFKYDIL